MDWLGETQKRLGGARDKRYIVSEGGPGVVELELHVWRVVLYHQHVAMSVE